MQEVLRQLDLDQRLTAIRAVHATTGGQLPASIAGRVAGAQRVEQLRTATLDTDEIIAQVTAAEPDQIDTIITEAATRAANHHATTKLLDLMPPVVWDIAITNALDQHYTDLADSLRPGLTGPAKALRAAAPKLPRGPQPLADLEAIVAARAGDALIKTRDALAALHQVATAAGVPDLTRALGTPPAAADLAPILAIPDTEQRINGTKATPGTHSVRLLLRSLDDNGVDNTLVRIARGELPGLDFDLATDLNALRARHNNIINAAAAPLRDPNRRPLGGTNGIHVLR